MVEEGTKEAARSLLVPLCCVVAAIPRWRRISIHHDSGKARALLWAVFRQWQRKLLESVSPTQSLN